MKPKFKFYEVVSIKHSASIPDDVQGTEGVITGMAESDEGEWHYSVMLYARNGIAMSIPQDNLLPSGKQLKREDIFSTKSIKVNRHGNIVP